MTKWAIRAYNKILPGSFDLCFSTALERPGNFITQTTRRISAMLARQGREGQPQVGKHDPAESRSESTPRPSIRKRAHAARLGVCGIRGRLRDCHDPDCRCEGDLIEDLVMLEDHFNPNPRDAADTPLQHLLAHGYTANDADARELIVSGILDSMGIAPIDSPRSASPAHDPLFDDADTLFLEEATPLKDRDVPPVDESQNPTA